MSDSVHGHGAVLSIGGTTIGNIISITGPNQTRDSIDVSTMDSTSKWREFIPGMLDAGEVTFTCNYDGTAAGSANDLNTIKTNAAATVLITFPRRQRLPRFPVPGLSRPWVMQSRLRTR